MHPDSATTRCSAPPLGLKNLRPFLRKPRPVHRLGFQAAARLSRVELAKRLERATGVAPRILPGGPDVCRNIGVVTGGAGSKLKQAADEGVDTFITGEGPHWTYAAAEELGINVLYGGHYATETFGVKALAAHLSAKFKVPWMFLDHPTGL
jgi:putative NIF3 family GTP cyclohydrolase 1 type 2